MNPRKEKLVAITWGIGMCIATYWLVKCIVVLIAQK